MLVSSKTKMFHSVDVQLPGRVTEESRNETGASMRRMPLQGRGSQLESCRSVEALFAFRFGYLEPLACKPGMPFQDETSALDCGILFRKGFRLIQSSFEDKHSAEVAVILE